MTSVEGGRPVGHEVWTPRDVDKVTRYIQNTAQAILGPDLETAAGMQIEVKSARDNFRAEVGSLRGYDAIKSGYAPTYSAISNGMKWFQNGQMQYLAGALYDTALERRLSFMERRRSVPVSVRGKEEDASQGVLTDPHQAEIDTLHGLRSSIKKKLDEFVAKKNLTDKEREEADLVKILFLYDYTHMLRKKVSGAFSRGTSPEGVLAILRKYRDSQN